jgi:3-hydroxyacyl-CoA dehydrogenase
MSTANQGVLSPHELQRIDTGLHARSLSGPARPEQPANDLPRTIGRVGIIGATSIGIGIAKALLEADIPVTMFDKRDALDRGLALLRADCAQAADRRDRCLALFNATPRFHHLKDADLILEVMPTETEAREKFFRWLDEIGKPDAILATHASGSQLDRIARLTRRPADVLGLDLSHLDDSSEQVKLVCGRETSGDTSATVLALLGRIGKLRT